MMIWGQEMFSADLVFLSWSTSTSRLLGCFSRRVEEVLPRMFIWCWKCFNYSVLWGKCMFCLQITVTIHWVEAERCSIASQALLRLSLLYCLRHLLAVNWLVGKKTADLSWIMKSLGNLSLPLFLTPPLKENTQHDSPKKENNENQYNFIILEILDS